MKNDKENTIWCERYRPDSLKNYIADKHFKAKLQSYIDQQDIPHLLFCGSAGTGKCLGGNEEILVEIELTKEEVAILKNYIL